MTWMSSSRPRASPKRSDRVLRHHCRDANERSRRGGDGAALARLAYPGNPRGVGVPRHVKAFPRDQTNFSRRAAYASILSRSHPWRKR